MHLQMLRVGMMIWYDSKPANVIIMHPRHATPSHAEPRHAMPCVPRHTTPCCDVLRYAFHAASRDAVKGCGAMRCDAAQRRPCHHDRPTSPSFPYGRMHGISATLATHVSHLHDRFWHSRRCVLTRDLRNRRYPFASPRVADAIHTVNAAAAGCTRRSRTTAWCTWSWRSAKDTGRLSSAPPPPVAPSANSWTQIGQGLATQQGSQTAGQPAQYVARRPADCLAWLRHRR